MILDNNSTTTKDIIRIGDLNIFLILVQFGSFALDYTSAKNLSQATGMASKSKFTSQQIKAQVLFGPKDLRLV